MLLTPLSPSLSFEFVKLILMLLNLMSGSVKVTLSWSRWPAQYPWCLSRLRMASNLPHPLLHLQVRHHWFTAIQQSLEIFPRSMNLRGLLIMVTKYIISFLDNKFLQFLSSLFTILLSCSSSHLLSYQFISLNSSTLVWPSMWVSLVASCRCYFLCMAYLSYHED